jgi:CheY-like chemotaxis protein
VNSTPGVGSEFWFDIPLQLATAPVAANDATKQIAAPARSLRLLVAEDVPTNQLVIRATLKALGHDVTMVGDGAEALAQVQTADFDVLFIDMQMPVMDGIEATRRIRALGGKYASVPIIALTANAFAADREVCRVAGMNDFVTKPLVRDEITTAIARVLAPAPAEAAADAGPGSARFDPSRLSMLIEWTDIDDAEEIVSVFADEVPALLTKLQEAAAQPGPWNHAGTIRSMRSAAAELGFVNAVTTCDAYLKRHDDDIIPIGPILARLKVEFDEGLSLARAFILERREQNLAHLRPPRQITAVQFDPEKSQKAA